jgi:hypothetical protein
MRIRKRVSKKASTSSPQPTKEIVSMMERSDLLSTAAKVAAEATVAGGKKSGSTAGMTHLRQQQLQQQLMGQTYNTNNNALAGQNMSTDEHLQHQQVLHQQQQQRQRIAMMRHQSSSPSSGPNSHALHNTMGPTTTVTFGSHGSVTTSLEADKASLHHHTIPPNNLLENESDYLSQKIQIQRNLEPDSNLSSLNFLPAHWNTQFIPRNIDPPHDPASSSSLFRPSISGGSSPVNDDNIDVFTSKLKVIQDPVSSATTRSSAAPVVALVTSSSYQQPSLGPNFLASSLRRQEVHQNPQEELLRNFQQQQQLYQQQLRAQAEEQKLIQEQQQRQQQQNNDNNNNNNNDDGNLLFHLPLSSDLEPTPFPD